MKKRSKLIGLTLCLALAAGCLAACGGGGSGNKAKVKEFILEAEYTNLDGLVGSGLSTSKSGVDLINGDGTEEQKKLGWSSGYFIFCTYAEGFTLTFPFTSDAAVDDATLILRLGSEVGDINFSSELLSVKVNGGDVPYTGMTVAGSEIDTTKFYDKALPAPVSLKEGDNVITLTVMTHTIPGIGLGGPLIDCIKLKTKANIAWEPKTDNPDGRGGI